MHIAVVAKSIIFILFLSLRHACSDFRNCGACCSAVIYHPGLAGIWLRIREYRCMSPTALSDSILTTPQDCWSLCDRDPDTNELVPDPLRFPRGIKALADDIHALGLKIGIYR